jgi:anti-sigma B factor antagonist
VSDLARVEVAEVGESRLAKICGEVDVSNADGVGKILERAAEDWLGRFVIDLSQTSYVDSVGLRIILSIAERLRARRRELYVIVPEDAVTRRVLLLVDLPKLASVYSSFAEIPPAGR